MAYVIDTQAKALVLSTHDISPSGRRKRENKPVTSVISVENKGYPNVSEYSQEAIKTNPRTEAPEHVRKRHRCDICDIQFSGVKDLHEHVMLRHAHPCRQCGKRFSKQASLGKHMTLNHANTKVGTEIKLGSVVPEITSVEEEIQNTQYELKCELCGKLFPEEPNLVEHMLSSHEFPESSANETIRYACGICDAQFSEYRYLQQHELTQHYHQCNHCRKKFLAERSLKRHVTLNHGVIKNAGPMELCGKQSPKERNVTEHIVSIHEPPPPTTNSKSSQPSLLDNLISFKAENSEEIDDRFVMTSSNVISAEASAEARPQFTVNTIPDTKAMGSKVMVMDKECPIYGINELDTLQISEHWEEDHGLAMGSPVEVWNTTPEEYNESNNEFRSAPEPSTCSPGQEDSSTTLARDGHAYRRSNPSDTPISQAVSTAFQENMSPLRQNIEAKLNSFRRETLGRDEHRTMHDMADNVQKLATASSACSNRMS